MTYKAIDIARYVINYLEDSGRHISNLKLQKILYYIQAAFLSETGLPCYEDDIVRWRHGPVVKSVYDEFRCYTDENIPKQSEIPHLAIEDGQLVMKNIPFTYDAYAEADRKWIERVVEGLAGFNPWYLVDRTHEEDPWQSLDKYNLIISKTSIKEYFQQESHKGRIYGKYDQ